jgi:hypothetical protein
MGQVQDATQHLEEVQEERLIDPLLLALMRARFAAAARLLARGGTRRFSGL